MPYARTTSVKDWGYAAPVKGVYVKPGTPQSMIDQYRATGCAIFMDTGSGKPVRVADPMTYAQVQDYQMQMASLAKAKHAVAEAKAKKAKYLAEVESLGLYEPPAQLLFENA